MLLHQRAAVLATKLETFSTFKDWVDLTMPKLRGFLYTCGWDGGIIVLGEKGQELMNDQPGITDNQKTLVLHRTKDYYFRLGSEPFDPELGLRWEMLFKSICTQLVRDLRSQKIPLTLLGSFDYFITSEKDCPGFAKEVAAVLEDPQKKDSAPKSDSKAPNSAEAQKFVADLSDSAMEPPNDKPQQKETPTDQAKGEGKGQERPLTDESEMLRPKRTLRHFFSWAKGRFERTTSATKSAMKSAMSRPKRTLHRFLSWAKGIFEQTISATKSAMSRPKRTLRRSLSRAKSRFERTTGATK